jgi:hypothetical protein
MEKRPRHRPRRRFPDAQRMIVECDLAMCPHCGQALQGRRAWHMRKTIQTLQGPLFVAGKSKECANPACPHAGAHYYASRVLMLSLPHSTYGLDVLAFIGWQHEQEHRQLAEIQGMLSVRGVEINKPTVGKLYRQFLALLAGMGTEREARLAETAAEHGGLIWAIDALQPEGHGTLMYVLYEVLGHTPVAAIQLEGAKADELEGWLEPYRSLPHPVLATISDGEKAIVAAMERCWPEAAHQRCQAHFLDNLAEPLVALDAQLRRQMRDDLGGLPPVPERITLDQEDKEGKKGALLQPL